MLTCGFPGCFPTRESWLVGDLFCERPRVNFVAEVLLLILDLLLLAAPVCGDTCCGSMGLIPLCRRNRVDCLVLGCSLCTGGSRGFVLGIAGTLAGCCFLLRLATWGEDSTGSSLRLSPALPLSSFCCFSQALVLGRRGCTGLVSGF